ncbi:MAG: hypothetical protein ACXVEF_12210 [Polyangiales bacterium]
MTGEADVVRRRRAVLVFTVAAAVTALYLGQLWARDSRLYQRILTERTVRAIGAAAKVVPLYVGAVYAARCVSHYDKGSTVRRAWIAMSAWLGCFAIGQTILTVYPFGLGRDAPIPSIADPFYLVGYLCLIAGLVMFVRAYRASGFAVGRLREVFAIGLASCVVFVAIGAPMLLPVARSNTPLAERIVNIGYPLLDLVVLVPTLVLLRIAARFQGGRVFGVWAAILAGIVFFTGGDILFADVSPAAQVRFGPLVDLLFALGFIFNGYGATLQHALLTEE